MNHTLTEFERGCESAQDTLFESIMKIGLIDLLIRMPRAIEIMEKDDTISEEFRSGAKSTWLEFMNRHKGVKHV